MNRLRSRDYRVLEQHTVNAYGTAKWDGCSSPLTEKLLGTSTSSLKSGIFATMRDTTVPGYRSRSSKGEVFFNPCERVEYQIDAIPGGSGSCISSTVSCSGAGSYFYRARHPMVGSMGRVVSGFDYPVWPDGMLVSPPFLLGTSDLQSLTSEVSAACLSSIGKSDSNLYESLAEANQALGLLPSLLKDALAIASRSGFGRVKSAASAYLAWRYGLKPIISDVESILKGIQQATGKVRRTYRSQRSMSTTKTETVPLVSPLWATYPCDCIFTHKETVTVSAMTLCEYHASVMSNVGFTTKGLLTLPWELIPYSFVVDWFVNVGDYLGSLVPDASMMQLGSCLVVKRELVTDMVTNASAPSGYSLLSQPIGRCGRKIKTYTRTPGVLKTGLVVKSDFRLTNLTRALDALALVVQKLR